MTQRFTKTELIKLKNEYTSVKEAKKILEERVRELRVKYMALIKQIKHRADAYNQKLKALHDEIMEIAERYMLFEVERDARIQGEADVRVVLNLFMNKQLLSLQEVNFPILKGDAVSSILKKNAQDKLKDLLNAGKELDELVKKANIMESEIERLSRKVGYLENVFLPKIKRQIKQMENAFSQRRRDELQKMKKAIKKGGEA